MMLLATLTLLVTLLSISVPTGMSNLQALLTALEMYQPPYPRSSSS